MKSALNCESRAPSPRYGDRFFMVRVPCEARFSNETIVPASSGSRIFVRVRAHVSRAARFSVS